MPHFTLLKSMKSSWSVSFYLMKEKNLVFLNVCKIKLVLMSLPVNYKIKKISTLMNLMSFEYRVRFCRMNNKLYYQNIVWNKIHSYAYYLKYSYTELIKQTFDVTYLWKCILKNSCIELNKYTFEIMYIIWLIWIIQSSKSISLSAMWNFPSTS